MEMLKLRIDAIKQGKSRAGEGISEPTIDKYMPHTPPPKQMKPQQDQVWIFNFEFAWFRVNVKGFSMMFNEVINEIYHF